MARGYWFNTLTLETLDVELTSHIKAVMADPAAFGTTAEAIREAYAVTREPLGFEGKARGKILVEVIQKTAWVRLREHDSREGFYGSVTCRDSSQLKAVYQNFEYKPEICRVVLTGSQ